MKDRNGSHSISQNWIALAAIRETETIRVRLKILDATLGAVLIENQLPLLNEWDGLKAELTKRGRERNTVVHGNWWLSDELPKHLILERRNGSLTKYTLRDLEVVLERIVAVWRRCYSFQLAILEAKTTGAISPVA